MQKFSRPVQVRWSDLDPNFHLRHSVYYDWGAFCRVAFLNEHGLTSGLMQALQMGPILFREECVFRKEIRSDDEVVIDLTVIKAKRDYSRWSIQHRIIKSEAVVCAILTVEGAWLNTVARKLATPPQQVHLVFEQMPKSENFVWLD